MHTIEWLLRAVEDLSMWESALQKGKAYSNTCRPGLQL